jgi:hypothetical protein
VTGERVAMSIGAGGVHGWRGRGVRWRRRRADGAALPRRRGYLEICSAEAEGARLEHIGGGAADREVEARAQRMEGMAIGEWTHRRPYSSPPHPRVPFLRWEEMSGGVIPTAELHPFAR